MPRSSFLAPGLAAAALLAAPARADDLVVVDSSGRLFLVDTDRPGFIALPAPSGTGGDDIRALTLQPQSGVLVGLGRDRLYAIDRGEIIFEGEPKRAFENPDVMKTIRG